MMETFFDGNEIFDVLPVIVVEVFPLMEVDGDLGAERFRENNNVSGLCVDGADKVFLLADGGSNASNDRPRVHLSSQSISFLLI